MDQFDEECKKFWREVYIKVIEITPLYGVTSRNIDAKKIADNALESFKSRFQK